MHKYSAQEQATKLTKRKKEGTKRKQHRFSLYSKSDKRKLENILLFHFPIVRPITALLKYIHNNALEIVWTLFFSNVLRFLGIYSVIVDIVVVAAAIIEMKPKQQSLQSISKLFIRLKLNTIQQEGFLCS
jgi:cytochrome c biogenesis factor